MQWRRACATNADQMLVAVDVSLSYSIKPERVPHFYVKFRNDDLRLFTHGYLRNEVRDNMNIIGGKYKIEQIMGDNGAFIHEVRAALQHSLDPIGVNVEQFGIIGAPRPPQTVVASINARTQATQIAIQKQNELVQVQADMAKEREKADTYARNEIVKAEAEAEANRKKAASLTPTLVEYLKASRWNGQLPQVTSGNVLMSISKE